LSAFRGQTVSMIFQEPALALDPVYTIGRQIAESVMRHEGKSEKEATRAARDAGGGPHSLRQAPPRCLSARNERRHAAARDDRAGTGLQAKILLADEPTTALDATVQIQILLLLRELQREFGMS
jgi:ABC-type dipeptide/oligopeptide/nickel transport system, ATPase component